MLQPERMCAITLLAEKDILPRLVHVLQSLGNLQPSPLTAEGERGLSRAAAHVFFPVEGYLVTLRSIKEYLGVRPPNRWEPVTEAELLISLPEQVEELSAEVRQVRERSEALAAAERNLERELRALEPFADLQVDLSLLAGYDAVRLLAVLPAGDLRDIGVPFVEVAVAGTPLDSRTSSRLLRAVLPGGRSAPRLRLLAARSEIAAALEEKLAASGAKLIKLPEANGGGLPRERMFRLQAQKGKTRAELAVLERRREELAEKWGLFVYAAEEALVSLLSKNLGATGFLVSKYALAGRFWAKAADVAAIKAKLAEHFPAGLEVHVEDAAEPGHGGEKVTVQPVPTALRTSWWTRPFVLLTEMFDTPAYGEFDPTALLAICFPLFFGFMIGDLGYGVAIAVGGLLLLRRFGNAPFDTTVRDLARILVASGCLAMIFGLFVFADAFGIPFHQEEGAAFWWDRLVPGLPPALLLKTEGESVNDMLLLSVIVGWLHMGLGCVFGIINAAKHSKRHALGRLGQLFVISGFSMLILELDAFRNGGLGRELWGSVLAPAAAAGPMLTVALPLVAGMTLVAVGEGPLGLIEFLGLFGNVISFTRLALVGVSKAAVAIAVNTVLVPQLLAGGAIWKYAAVWAALLVAHLALVLLGCLSSAIQSVRLHYCETFSKFFQGGGVKFEPFKFSRVFTRS